MFLPDAASFGGQFFIGTVTGIAATVTLWFLRGFFGVAWSLVQARAQGNRSVHGLWTAEYEKGDVRREEQVNLRQFLHRVWGTIDNKSVGSSYKVSGTIRHGVLVATYELKGRSHAIDRGAFAISLSTTGDSMVGSYAWTETDNQVPKAGTYRWTRFHVPD